MTFRNSLFVLIMAALLLMTAGQLLAYPNGPPTGRTGAPGQQTCNTAGCHNSFTINTGGGTLNITGAPANYALDTDYTITVTLNKTDARRWGFELAALKTADNAQAGTITVTDAANTQLVAGGGISYLMHTNAGTKAGTTGPASWSFSWKSPATDMGPIKFYAAGNAANNNGTNSGDYIYTTDAQTEPAAVMAGNYDFTLALTGMNPHVGQTGHIRIVDLYNGREVARAREDSIEVAFNWILEGILEEGHSYNVDFWADHNRNGVYDAPGTGDHAWRRTISNATADVTENFAHNTTFTDIMWDYAVTLNLTGMTPHLNKYFGARLIDISTGREVSRDTMTISNADFSVTLPGVEPGGDYTVDFFADHNGNGVYDAPTADHAWRYTLADAVADTTFNFSHNTTFTDIAWDYRATVRFTGMTPHVGQILGIRAIDMITGMEVGRTEIDAVPAADFALSVSGLRKGGSYNIDFYADLNGNDMYDAPPADHAWRLEAKSVAGDVSLDFAHNTNFTTTGWGYDARLYMTGMTPHVGQIIFLRLYETATGQEISRRIITSLPSATVMAALPGVQPNGHYTLDFAADLNRNGMYDAPGTGDHAWRLRGTADAEGRLDFNFAHNTRFTNIAWPYTVTLNLTNMTPHVGQGLYYRLVEVASGMEISRGWTASVPAATFSLWLPGIQVGGNYYLDFFADLNKNGVYNAPGTGDHAWRLEIMNATGNSELAFVHNTTFTDIQWPYRTIISFTGMTPHLGQKLYARVTEMATGIEVGRAMVDSIPGADFTLPVVGIHTGGDYAVDFFADHNRNGMYDAPGTGDHAWRLQANSVTGDYPLAFAHNTSFTDISWPYRARIDFKSMTPHLGKSFYLRLVSQGAGGEDYGEQWISAIPSADYSMYLPGLEPGENYYIQFFADHNDNKSYDAPPTDHAWQIPITAGTSDTTLEFTHNTNFTDIQWDLVSDVVENENPGVLKEFSLAQNFPNPFNPSTTIEYTVPENAHVTMTIYNILGQKVATLIDRSVAAGTYRIIWNGANEAGVPVAGGLYIYRLQTEKAAITKKMIFMK